MKKGLRSFPAAIQIARFHSLTPFHFSQPTPALRGQVLGEVALGTPGMSVRSVGVKGTETSRDEWKLLSQPRPDRHQSNFVVVFYALQLNTVGYGKRDPSLPARTHGEVAGFNRSRPAEG